MASERRTPWFKFYAPDWRSDLSLRECGYAARGLWIDMLTIMHEAEPYGHLVISGKPAGAKRLAALLGGTEREVAGLLAQLQEAGVYSLDDAGTIYSRRMVRDERREAEKQDIGKRFGPLGGNPNIRRGTVAKEERVRRFRPSDNPAKAARIFDKTGGLCHWCKRPLQREHEGVDFFHCDHVVAICDGGSNEDNNLVPACAACNHKRARKDWSDPNERGQSDPNHARKSDPNPHSHSQYQEESKQRSVPPSRALRDPMRAAPAMPTLADPPEAWEALGDGWGTDRDGVKRPAVGGYCLDLVAREVCDAAGMDGRNRAVDWRPLIALLREGYTPHGQIIPTIQRVASRPGYAPPRFLTYFDQAIREARAA